MTGPYEWNPMPHVVDVVCPVCRALARFEFAEFVPIRRREDVAFFQASAQFEHRFVRRPAAGTSYHAAVYYQGLHGRPREVIHGLPEGYEAREWEHSKYLYRNHGTDLGSLTCSACGLRRVHELSWPAEAYFQIEYRGDVLWAFHRESAAELRAYVASTTRDRCQYVWESFLRHVPSKFLEAKARATVVKRLDKLLAS